MAKKTLEKYVDQLSGELDITPEATYEMLIQRQRRVDPDKTLRNHAKSVVRSLAQNK